MSGLAWLGFGVAAGVLIGVALGVFRIWALGEISRRRAADRAAKPVARPPDVRVH